MSVNKLYDVTQFGEENLTVLRRILDQVSHDALTFKFTDKVPTVSTVNFHEVVLYDNGKGARRMCVKTGKGNLICFTFGGIGPATLVDADYTIKATDFVLLVDATAAPVTVTLPTAVGIEGRTYEVKRVSSNANTVTLVGDGSETIDESTEQIYTLPYVSLTVYSDGGNWWII
jgi:hypothetical protein